MSLSAPDALSLTGLGSSGLPAIDPAELPASIRTGTPAAKAAYAEGLAFEQVLVNELTQQGIESRAYRPGPYANQEGLLAAFDRYYLRCMSG